MDSTQNKLIADLHIGYSKLRDEIKEVNTLLGTLGKNVTIDFSDVVKKQVKSSIEELVKEAKVLGETTRSQNEKAGKSFEQVASQIKTVQSTIRETDAQGKLLSETIRGIGENGEKISETLRFKSDGSTDFKRKSEEISEAIRLEKEEAALWKQIEAEQKAARSEEAALWRQIKEEQSDARREESALWKQIKEEQREAKKEESELWKQIESEQKAYITAIDKTEKDYISALVSYENAKAKLAGATPGTNEWNVYKKNVDEAKQDVDRVVASINDMDVPDSVKQEIKDVAEHSQKVADAQNNVELATARATDQQNEHAEKVA